MSNDHVVTLFATSKGNTLDSNTFASFAEDKIAPENSNKVRELKYAKLSMSKLRKIYAQIMNLYTKINSPEDFEIHKSDLQYLKIKMAYEAGREKSVDDFLKGTFLMQAIDLIKTYQQFILYCRYAESLVAYFKYYGGKD